MFTGCGISRQGPSIQGLVDPSGTESHGDEIVIEAQIWLEKYRMPFFSHEIAHGTRQYLACKILSSIVPLAEAMGSSAQIHTCVRGHDLRPHRAADQGGTLRAIGEEGARRATWRAFSSHGPRPPRHSWHRSTIGETGATLAFPVS